MNRILSALLVCSAMAAPLAADDAVDAPTGAEQTAPKAHADQISAAELKKLVEAKGVVLIDCNGSESYKAGHIPGAIDGEADKAKLGELLPKDKAALVVAYCGGPKCGAYKAGVEAATKLGYTNVKHFSGGLSGWKEAGFALDK